MADDFFAGGSSASPVEIPAVLAGTALAALFELLELGALVSFGTSRDGGTLSCTVTHEGEWVRGWFRSEAELALWLQDGTAAVDQRVRSASNGSRPRNRGREGRRSAL